MAELCCVSHEKLCGAHCSFLMSGWRRRDGRDEASMALLQNNKLLLKIIALDKERVLGFVLYLHNY